MMGAHLIDGEFQSDKYPTTPRGKVPLSVNDKTAQDLLWEYAHRRRTVDAEFADDLEAALLAAGFDVNVPETASFIGGVIREGAHQRVRWGEAHDRSKSAENWFWLVGYLAGKALRAAIAGDREKALHHTISAAAALAQWHAAVASDESGRGIGTDADLNAGTHTELAAPAGGGT